MLCLLHAQSKAAWGMATGQMRPRRLVMARHLQLTRKCLPMLLLSGLPVAEPTAAAVGAHHGTHTAHHQQQQHARHPHQRPMSEQQRRMEAGINRSSRLWQVPDGADSLAHSLGASPFDEEHSGGSGMPGASGMPVLQILPTISPDGSMMLTASE